jgi:hypothetical protein
MKIGILTQPLFNNYGGLLQAYALQKYLSKEGHDVLTIDFSKPDQTKKLVVKDVIFNFIRKYILKRSVTRIFPETKQEKTVVSQNTARFRFENIRTTQPIHLMSDFDYIQKYNFDAYIVGSDQVWRPIYSPGLPAFFMSFVSDNSKIKRIAYAASFGIDNCNEYSQEKMPEYSKWLKKFDAVGVREASAVNLCEEHFGVKAEHVLDPTLLLDKKEYISLLEKDNTPKSRGNMMVYVLDIAKDKQDIIKTVANIKGLTPFSVMQDSVSGIYPPVTQWLRGFMDAEYVVTDSFHGVAFSIIFNKPFIAIGNKERGLARFTSILNLLGLQNRLVFTSSDLNKDIVNAEIDYERVNTLLSREKCKATDFLKVGLASKLKSDE